MPASVVPPPPRHRARRNTSINLSWDTSMRQPVRAPQSPPGPPRQQDIPRQQEPPQRSLSERVAHRSIPGSLRSSPVPDREGSRSPQGNSPPPGSARSRAEEQRGDAGPTGNEGHQGPGMAEEDAQGSSAPWEVDRAQQVRRRVVFPHQMGIRREPPIARKGDQQNKRVHGIINDNVPRHEAIFNDNLSLHITDPQAHLAPEGNVHRPTPRPNHNTVLQKAQALLPDNYGLVSGYKEDLPAAVQTRLKAFAELPQRRHRLRDLLKGDAQRHDRELGPRRRLLPPEPRHEIDDLDAMSLPMDGRDGP